MIVFMFGFSYFVISSTSTNENDIDESRVKDVPLLKHQRKKDDSMRVAMEKKSQPDVVMFQPPLSENETQKDKTKPTEENTTSDYQQPPEIVIPERHEESLFSSVSRFDSSGASLATGNYHHSTQSEPPIDSEEARLRAFAQADTEAEVRKLTGSSGGLMTGRIGGK